MGFNPVESLPLGEAIDGLRAQAEGMGYRGGIALGTCTFMYAAPPHERRLTVQGADGRPDPRFIPEPYLDLIPAGMDMATFVNGRVWLDHFNANPLKGGTAEPDWPHLPREVGLYGAFLPVVELKRLYVTLYGVAQETGRLSPLFSDPDF